MSSGWRDSRRWSVFYPRRSGFQLSSSLRSHDQLDALSAATVMALTAIFRVCPLIPSDAIIFPHDAAGKPESSHFYWEVPRLPPCFPALHQNVFIHGILSYIGSPMELSPQSPPVSLLLSDINRTSGLFVVSTIVGKIRFFSRSTRSSRSKAMLIMPSPCLPLHVVHNHWREYIKRQN